MAINDNFVVTYDTAVTTTVGSLIVGGDWPQRRETSERPERSTCQPESSLSLAVATTSKSLALVAMISLAT